MTRDNSYCDGGERKPMGIFWDMKSCPIPEGVNHEDLANNILEALRGYLTDYYPKVFFVYRVPGDFPSPLLGRWERDGLTFHNVGDDRGDYDMFTHMIDLAFDHPRPKPAGMVLISREWDHLSQLLRLGSLGHRGVLIYPLSEPFPEVAFSKRLVSCLDWRSVVNGYSQIFFSDDQPSVAAPAAVDG